MNSKSNLTVRLSNDREISGDFIEMDDIYIVLENAYFHDDTTFVFTIKFNISYIVNTTSYMESEEVYDEVQADLRKDEEEEFVGESMELGNVPEGYDQIKENQRKYGIEFKYNESEYTSTIDRNSDFWKDNVESAKKIEREILRNRRDRNEEREEDEGRYSDVVKRKPKGMNYRNNGRRRDRDLNDSVTNINLKGNHNDKYGNKGRSDNMLVGSNRRKDEQEKERHNGRGYLEFKRGDAYDEKSRKDSNMKSGIPVKTKSTSDRKFNRSESYENIKVKSGNINEQVGSKAKVVAKDVEKSVAKSTGKDALKGVVKDGAKDVIKDAVKDVVKDASKDEKMPPVINTQVKKEPFSWSNVNLNKTENQPKTDKRITYGKPTPFKFKKLNELITTIKNNFTFDREMKKKWKIGTQSFLSYTEDNCKSNLKK